MRRAGITPGPASSRIGFHNLMHEKHLQEIHSFRPDCGALLAFLNLPKDHQDWSPTRLSARGAFVRGITGTLVILLVAGYLASTVELPRAWSSASTANAQAMDGWRRTANGWEWQRVWKRPQPRLDPPPVAWRIHPFSIAALQVLVSLFALVWADKSHTATPRHAT